MTMSQSNAYSECAVTGPLMAADHRHFDTDDVFEDLRALAEDLVESGGREEIETFGRDLGQNSLPVPVRMTTWLSGSSPMSRNARTSASCNVAVETRAAPRVCKATSRIAVFPLHFHVVVFIR